MRLRFLALAVLAVVAIGVAFAALTRSTPESAASYTPPPATLTSPKPAATVSMLSDSHAFNADSWWRQTVLAGKIDGLVSGAFESQPGAESVSLARRLDAATAKKGFVIVQAGTNDLLSHKSPADAASGVEALWQGVRERGATPVAALVPPSDSAPAAVMELNALLAEAAKAQGLILLDTFTPVATPDGTWAEGTTTDGTHSNKAGSDLMAAAAKDQLVALTK